MSPRADLLILKLLQPNGLTSLLDPPAPPGKVRLMQVARAVIDFEDDDLKSVQGVTLQEIVVQTPLATMQSYQETHLDSQSMKRTEVVGTSRSFADPLWLDIDATLRLTLVVESGGAEIAALTTEDIEGYATLNDFASRFHYLDLPEFLAARQITTVEELRERAHYVLTEIKLKPRPAFNAADAANSHAVSVRFGAVIRDEFDLGEALRALSGLRQALGQTQVARSEIGLSTGRRRTPAALAAIFPSAAIAGSGFTAAQIENLFAAQGFLALFADP